MGCNIDNLCNEIDELRTTLNEMSITLMEDNRNNIEIINISVRLDDLINKYITLIKKHGRGWKLAYGIFSRYSKFVYITPIYLISNKSNNVLCEE